MALRYLLDTNICIYIAKQRPSAVAKRFARLAAGTVRLRSSRCFLNQGERDRHLHTHTI